jgi:phytoene synthase
MNRKFFSIFKKGSKTYFYSSLFFPKHVRDKVFTLYSFVRVADNFVDAVPQQKEEFYLFKEQYEKSLKGKKTGNEVVDAFTGLMEESDFDPAWVEAFLKSMEMDLYKHRHRTLEESLEYIYGSAEVIGLMMSRILGLPEKSFEAARMQGRAMQYINFIRDIQEDNELGRIYLPLNGSPLENLEKTETENKFSIFQNFIRDEIKRYEDWQEKAGQGYRYIPKRYLIPIKTASDLYNWTARQIQKDPAVVYQRKVKPKIPLILFYILKILLESEGGGHESRGSDWSGAGGNDRRSQAGSSRISSGSFRTAGNSRGKSGKSGNGRVPL